MLKPYQLELLRDVVGRRCPQVASRVQSADVSGLTVHTARSSPSRRGVAFGVVARTRVGADERLQVTRSERRDAPGVSCV
jgi:hypothetical protein